MGAKKRSQRVFSGITSSVVLTGLIFALALAGSGRASCEPAASVLPPETQALLNQIGKWQGAQEEANLESPYEDPHQQEIPFGRISFYLTPWRAYMDTWPAKQYLNSLGINLKVPPATARATAQVVAQAGFRSARVELGWGNLGYYDPRQISHGQDYREILQALRAAGIRPLVLLNCNSGSPVPAIPILEHLWQKAPQGAREIVVDRPELIRPGYTGLVNMANQRLGFPLVTAVDPKTGRCQLSAPLPRELPPGKLNLVKLAYHPFSGPLLADGTPNPFALETLEGWKAFVATACQITKEALGTEGAKDAGFDLEVWNEYSIGRDFLDEKYYYDPPRQFKSDITYKNHGLSASGPESILPLTVDYVKDPANRLPGVEVISGFSNQRPWDSGASMWPGQSGFSRHYYTNLNPSGRFNGFCGLLSPFTNTRPGSGPLNALGLVDGKKDGKNWFTVTPGTFFVPSVQFSMPEGWHYAFFPEYMTRDLQPFPSLWADHYRYSNRGDGHPAQVWMTETNTDRSAFLKRLMSEQGLEEDNPGLIALSHQLGAKALLRTFIFQSHKGVHTIEVFAAKGGDLSLGVIPESFFNALKEDDYQLTSKVRAQVGSQLKALARVTELFKKAEPLEVTRPLALTELVEHEPRLVFKGDGTPAHPDRFNRDDFACLPFQMAADKYVIPYYVVTRNMVHVWNPALSPLDPRRYDMPEQTFDLTLQNLRGSDAKVSAWDPLTNQKVPVSISASSENSLKVGLPCVDYPRFLLVEESRPGPLILSPELRRETDGHARVTFQTNLPARAKLSWGPWPERRKDGQVDLAEGTSFEYEIPHLAKLEGVRLTVERDGLTTPWPRWEYDNAGVLWQEAEQTIATGR